MVACQSLHNTFAKFRVGGHFDPNRTSPPIDSQLRASKISGRVASATARNGGWLPVSPPERKESKDLLGGASEREDLLNEIRYKAALDVQFIG
jgi:hypothetical protein